MQVAIDARNLQDRPIGGIGRVLRNVLPTLASEFDVTLLADPRRGPAPEGAVTLRSPLPSAAAWLQDAAPRWLRGFDGLFHCPFYGLPYRQPVPMVASLWDLTFEFRPDWFPMHKRVAFRAQARHAARTARRIIVASSVVRDDVIARYHVEPDRIIVAPLAVEPRFHPRPKEGLRPAEEARSAESPRPERDPLPAKSPRPGKYPLTEASPRPERDPLVEESPRPAEDPQPTKHLSSPEKPYVVAFSGAPRRRVGVAVEAWRWAGGAPLCDLVIVGAPSGVSPTPGLVEAGRVDDDDRLAELLSGATALLYPTEYEGFGLPALEAQASGTPVVCARVGALPEALGGVAAWAPSTSATDLGASLQALLTDDGYRKELAAEGLAQAAARPGWDVAAAAFARAYREASA